MQLNRGVELFEMDGDGAFSQSVRQRANAGEGFGRKNDALAFAIGVSETAMEATGEDSAQDRILAAVARAEGGVAFVEEEGGALLRVMDAAAQSTGGEVGGKRGIGTQQAQELQTESFAGLLQGRLDGEIGSDLGGRKAMSMENPKGDQGALVLGAVEVAGEEGDNVVQFKLWPGRRMWFVCRWRGHGSGDGLGGQGWLLSVYSLFICLN